MSRYKSAVSRSTGRPREYRQRFARRGDRFWWTCSWTWRNGQLESCAGGWADSAEECEQRITEHVEEIHFDEVVL